MPGPWNVDLALADALAGTDSGWAFWLAALALLEQAIARSRERDGAFCNHPDGEWRRFAYDLEKAAGMLALAVDVQNAIHEEPDAHGPRRRELISDLLLDRVREARAERTGRYEDLRPSPD